MLFLFAHSSRMSWVEKHTSLSFDTLPIHGLQYIDGALLARIFLLKYGEQSTPFFHPDWIKNQKLPQVEFPSGESFDIWETSHRESSGIIHIFGEMDLPYFDTRDRAWEHAHDIAQQVGYLARKRGHNQLEVIGHDDDEHFLITYDNAERRMVNIEKVRATPELRRNQERQPLLDAESRSKLPPLYSNEYLGLAALAPVKFFHTGSSWTWYASEASIITRDGEYKPLADISPNDPSIRDVIFFGLVDGYELELGYFSLSELESLGGEAHFPVERDRWYTPMSLEDLQRKHRKERGED